MKTATFILVLFFSGIAFGQNTTKFIWDKDFPKRDNGNKIILYQDVMLNGQRILGGYKDTTYICFDFFARIGVELWNSYVKECWADSSISYTLRQFDSAATANYYKKHPEIPEEKRWTYISKELKYYTHRPTSWPGFIEFLKRKIGERK